MRCYMRCYMRSAGLHGDVAEHLDHVRHLGDSVLERLRVRRHQRELHHLPLVSRVISKESHQ